MAAAEHPASFRFHLTTENSCPHPVTVEDSCSFSAKKQFENNIKRIYKILLKDTKIFILLLIVIKSADMILCKRNEENIIPHHQ